MVSGAQRLGAQPAERYHAPAISHSSHREQAAQKIRRDCWHIAGNHQIPIGGGATQRRHDTSQRTAIRDRVRDDLVTQIPIANWVADQRGRSGGGLYLSRDIADERLSPVRQKSFIRSHSRTPASDQHKTGIQKTGAQHETMLTSAPEGSIGFTYRIAVIIVGKT